MRLCRRLCSKPAASSPPLKLFLISGLGAMVTEWFALYSLFFGLSLLCCWRYLGVCYRTHHQHIQHKQLLLLHKQHSKTQATTLEKRSAVPRGVPLLRSVGCSIQLCATSILWEMFLSCHHVAKRTPMKFKCVFRPEVHCFPSF